MDISHDEFVRFQAILEKFSGIALSENKQYLVASRLSPLIKLYKLNQFSDLLALIERVGICLENKLLEQVVDLMTTNETLWFRDKHPFNFIINSVCSDSNTPRSFNWSETFRVLSVGCSTGQEPYSIAMSLDSINKLQDSEIMATDLSRTALYKAKTGIYQRLEMERGLSAENIKTYFSAIDESNWQIDQKLINKVSYRQLNLLATPYNLGRFDVILCRNVLIYFSEENKRKALEALFKHLKPNGYLLLGGAESLSAKSFDVNILRYDSGFAYQKKPESN